MEIFHYYFPTEITNVYCDDWINLIYSPNHIFKLKGYSCRNDGGNSRYNPITHSIKELLRKLVSRDKIKLKRYIKNDIK